MFYPLDAGGFEGAIVTLHATVCAFVEEAHLILLLLKLLLFAYSLVAFSVIDAEMSFPAGRTSEGTSRCELADSVRGGTIDADEGAIVGDYGFDGHATPLGTA